MSHVGHVHHHLRLAVRRAWGLILTALLAAGPLPAAASVMPDLRARPQPWTFSGGIHGVALVVPMPAAAIDYAVTDRWSVGAMVAPFADLGVRTTYRLISGPWGFQFGLGLSGGVVGPRHVAYGQPAIGPIPLQPFPLQAVADQPMGGDGLSQQLWGQAALLWALPLGGEDSPFVLRGDFGALLVPVRYMVYDVPDPATDPNGYRYEYRQSWAFVPHIELGWRFLPNHEVTVGGYGLLGYRYTF
jgi:hypothetical protein